MHGLKKTSQHGYHFLSFFSELSQFLRLVNSISARSFAGTGSTINAAMPFLQQCCQPFERHYITMTAMTLRSRIIFKRIELKGGKGGFLPPDFGSALVLTCPLSITSR
jgi:hypothetical protein